MKVFKRTIYVSIAILLLAVSGCKNAWDDAIKVNESTASATTMEWLSQHAEYSMLVEALKKTGLDEELENYISTIWAPTNTAMGLVSTEILDNTDSLRQYLGCLFTQGSLIYGTTLNADQRLKMYNGKYIDVTTEPKTFDEIAVSDNANEVNVVSKNGVIHTINSPVVLRRNVWEIIESLGNQNKQLTFLNSLSGEVFDPEQATQIGWTSDGKPIYDTISGMVWSNEYITNVADLRVEDSTFTFLIVEDQVFDQEYAKYKPYYKAFTGSTTKDSLANDYLVKMKVTKDYTVGYSIESHDIPAEVYSVDDVRIPFTEGAIVHTIKASNGYIYTVNSCDVALADKIKPIVVEGENPLTRWYAEGGAPGAFTRERANASGGYDFVLDNNANDILGGLIMGMGSVSSTRYDVYLKGINDFNASYKYPKSNLILTQKIGTVIGALNEDGVYEFGPPAIITGADSVAVTDTAYISANEILVGTTRFSTTRECFIQLTPNSKGQGVVVDYLKLVPVFN